MMIYKLVFGTDSGQVLCTFHNDTRKSAGIGPNGEYNCFVCNAKAHNEVGFIAKYFQVSVQRAASIKASLDRITSTKYTMLEVTEEQRNYLHSIGIIDEVINKYMYNSGRGKLMFNHLWAGVSIGCTWFNSPELSGYNASSPKYRYDRNIIAGGLVPYDDVIKNNTLLICEGEKDMLTAKSVGIPNAVAKIGGAKTYIVGGKNLHNKQIIICYDCDEFGREGAEQDARSLIERFKCTVKIIDLGLQNKEDLNDYFVKYKKTLADFKDLIKQTPVYVPKELSTKSKLQKIYDTLSSDELEELKKIIKEKQK